MPAKPITEAWLNATRFVAGKMLRGLDAARLGEHLGGARGSMFGRLATPEVLFGDGH